MEPAISKIQGQCPVCSKTGADVIDVPEEDEGVMTWHFKCVWCHITYAGHYDCVFTYSESVTSCPLCGDYTCGGCDG